MSGPVDLALVAVGAALASAGVLWILLRTGLAERLAVDTPNARSLHAKPIPRSGAWGVVGVSLPLAAILAPSLRGVLLIAAALSALSYVDDRVGLTARTRFAAHLGAAAATVLAWGESLAPWWMVLVVLAIGWMINLYNFMDGSDGLAGGMALFGFGTYALAAGTVEPQLASAAAAIAGAAAGFLLWNRHPARIFLGDAGSVPLGFLAAALGFWGWQRDVWPAWFPALVFVPFVADATVTLARRALRGDRVWEAHREHYYQRLVRMGLGHRRTALVWYVAMAGAGILALLLRQQPAGGQALGIAVALVLLVVAAGVVDRRWNRFVESRESVQ